MEKQPIQLSGSKAYDKSVNLIYRRLKQINIGFIILIT